VKKNNRIGRTDALLRASCCSVCSSQQYLDEKDRAMKDMTTIFLAGVKDALVVYNVVADADLDGRKLFCIPRNLALTTEQAEDILRRWIEKRIRSCAIADKVNFRL
jgi:hypothetical protein